MNKKHSEAQGGEKIIVQNKKARFDYHIVESFEAGIVLTGPEIKSVRLGEVSLAESYIRPDRGELYLINCHIKPYAFNTDAEYDATRKRKLLMHRHEIDKLSAKVDSKGFTIVALKLYLKAGRAKIELALAKGKNAPDKRQSTKERESKRELARALKAR